jgi:hypothetical protein
VASTSESRNDDAMTQNTHKASLPAGFLVVPVGNKQVSQGKATNRFACILDVELLQKQRLD